MLGIIRTSWLQLFVGAFLLVATFRVAAQSQPALALTIVPTSYSNHQSPEPIIAFSHPNHFHVLLTNISSEPVNIFEEWNLWGYFGLSFEITYADGRTVQVTKKARGWDKNFPSTLTIAPHGYYVFDVDFGDAWHNSIRTEPKSEPKSEHGIKCRMRAIYAIKPTEESLKDWELFGPQPVWSGVVSSEESAYLVYP